jgi:hypothetical protein
MRRLLQCGVVALGLSLVLSHAEEPALAQKPDLGVLLARAQQYVARYVELFSNAVAEERFVQDVRFRPTNPGATTVGPHRELRSELTVVSVGGALQWRPFRDVYEVDGRPVRDRDERVRRLFSQGADRALEQAGSIAQESARYNLGTVRRTLNVPGLPLLFVQASLRERFRFTLDKADREAWIIRFEEQSRPTLFNGDEGADAPSTGRLWVRADTGAITRTEHVIQQPFVSASFVTEFVPSDRFGVNVPSKLFEEYRQPDTTLSGTATYSNFRQFSVSVGEETSVENQK